MTEWIPGGVLWECSGCRERIAGLHKSELYCLYVRGGVVWWHSRCYTRHAARVRQARFVMFKRWFARLWKVVSF